MKGCYTEETLALYVEADLPEAQMERVSTHLVDCPECRNVVAELTETQSVFKSIRQDIAPASVHARVREHVINEVMRTPSGWSLRLERLVCGIRWRYAICGVALMVIAGAMFWEFHHVEQPASVANVNVASDRASVSEPQRDLPLNNANIAEANPPVRKTRKRVVDTRKPVVEPVALTQMEPAPINEEKDESSRSVMVKLMTDDPGIVIYWIVDQKGGSE
jgi:hypothetical protein